MTDGLKMSWRAYFMGLSRALDYPEPSISVSPAFACAVAFSLEFIYRHPGIRTRPPITRYLATHMGSDFHFSIARARQEPGYEPRVAVDEALRRAAAWLQDAVRGEVRQ